VHKLSPLSARERTHIHTSLQAHPGSSRLCHLMHSKLWKSMAAITPRIQSDCHVYLFAAVDEHCTDVRHTASCMRLGGAERGRSTCANTSIYSSPSSIRFSHLTWHALSLRWVQMALSFVLVVGVVARLVEGVSTDEYVRIGSLNSTVSFFFLSSRSETNRFVSQ
jgi:hypothetical protein